jgi:hypothetical protein
VAGDVIRRIDWPLVGHIPPARMVLFVSGLVVLLAAWLSREAPARAG